MTVVDFNKASKTRDAKKKGIVDALLSEIGPGRTNLLMLLGMRTLADVSDKPRHYYSCLYGFGEKSIQKIENCLCENGLSFSAHHPIDIKKIYDEEVSEWLNYLMQQDKKREPNQSMPQSNPWLQKPE